MPGDVLLIRRDGMRPGKAVLGLAQLAPLHHHHTQVVESLDISWLSREDLSVTRLSCIQVSEVVDVDVSHQNQPFCVVWVVPDQLVEEWRRLQWSVRVGEEQGEVEQSASEVRLQLDSPSKPGLSTGEVLAVHAEHAKVEEDSLIHQTPLRHNPVKPFKRQLSEM